jgi:hypothetical protein
VERQLSEINHLEGFRIATVGNLDGRGFFLVKFNRSASIQIGADADAVKDDAANSSDVPVNFHLSSRCVQ